VGASGFGVSILSARQSAIAARFAADPSEGRFDEVEWHADPSGHPRLGGAAAWLDCTLHEVLEAGDHSILIGRVEAYELGEHGPMVYHGGVFRSVEP
jgi:flavin reductase (DIM6/NTAB) family NADH-FMN oxidoreductase RutF